MDVGMAFRVGPKRKRAKRPRAGFQRAKTRALAGLGEAKPHFFGEDPQIRLPLLDLWVSIGHPDRMLQVYSKRETPEDARVDWSEPSVGTPSGQSP